VDALDLNFVISQAFFYNRRLATSSLWKREGTEALWERTATYLKLDLEAKIAAEAANAAASRQYTIT
jgi:hypothetical protein